MARGLARCPSCGATLDLEVEPFGADPDDPATTEVELGRQPSRWWAAGAVVGVVALLGAGAVAAGGRSTRAIDVTTTSTTPSTTARPTSTAPRRTTTSTTAPDPVRTTTLAVADVLDPQRSSGTVLYAMAERQDVLWRVDLRTGEALVRRIDGADGVGSVDPGTQLVLLPRTGGVVVSGSRAVFVPDDPSAPIVDLDAYYVLPHADPALIWRVSDGPRLMPVDMAGNEAGAPVAMDLGYVIGDDGTGRALISLGAATYSVSSDGSARKVASAPVLSAGAGRIVVQECADDAIRCDAVVRLIADGSEVGRVALPDEVWNTGWAGSLSPGGSALAVFEVDSSRIVVHRLDGSGSWAFPYVHDGPLYGGYGFTAAPVWWVDEGTVCGLVKEDTLRCWREGDNPGSDVVTLSGAFFSSMVLGGS